MDWRGYTEIKEYKRAIARGVLIASAALGLLAAVVNYQFGTLGNMYAAFATVLAIPFVLLLSHLQGLKYLPNITAAAIPLLFALVNTVINANEASTYIWLLITPVFLYVVLSVLYAAGLSLLLILFVIFYYLSNYQSHPQVDLALFSHIVVVYLFIFTLLLVHEFKQHRDERLLKREMQFDFLTDVYNRRGIMQNLANKIRYAQRYNGLLSVILIDLDDFKKINDNYGHDVGDDVLKYFANLVRLNIRDSDSIGRIGGEEFLVVVPGLQLNSALAFAEKLRKLTEEYVHVTGSNITASFGVTQFISGDSIETILKRSDQAMYSAKRRKNAVECG